MSDHVDRAYGELSRRGVRFTQTPAHMKWGVFAKFVDHA